MKDLMGYLPESYGGSPETQIIQAAMGPEMEALWGGRDGLLEQLTPYTATWGLALWERGLGLATDESKPVEYRRTRVVAKLRGNGTTTVELIKSVAESFSYGEVAVVEHYSDYKVEIRFVGTVGLPPNLEDLRAALRDIMPAHLTWDFVIYYRTHGQAGAYTHGQLAAFTHSTIREGNLHAANS